MAVSAEFIEFIVEQLERLGPIRPRRMFGGMGLYLDDMMFGVVFGEELYFKIDDRNRRDYEDEGMGPFTYEMSNGKTGSLNYYEVPERLYDDGDELAEWARKSVDVMMQVRAEKLARAARAAERKKADPKKKPASKKPVRKSTAPKKK
ncbi:MAG: TfoX/Sxy family protein [Parvibaculum sp.]